MCVKQPCKSLAEMISLANNSLGANVPHKTFTNVKSAFKTSGNLTFGQVLEAIKKYPRISKAEVLKLFENEALVHPNTLIDGQKIMRPHLITLVEALEEWTGLQMINPQSIDPLGDYDYNGVTIEDIAEYFSGEGGIIQSLKQQIIAENT